MVTINNEISLTNRATRL